MIFGIVGAVIAIPKDVMQRALLRILVTTL
jgi:hypothetical protein